MTIQQIRRLAPWSPPSRSGDVTGTILSIATVRDGLGYMDTEGLIESYNCIGIDVDPVDCNAFTTLTKRFDSPSFSDGHLFNVQGGLRCNSVGFDMNDSRIRAAFEAMEAEGVSIGIHDTILVNGTDLTPASGPVTCLQALGILESYGYGEYAGYPVIHMGPGMVSQLVGVDVLTKVGDHLETRLGTPVAVAAGVETKTNGKLDPEQWAFVTGAVLLDRGEVVHQAELDRSTNEATVLYERLYLAAVDCLVAKIKVQVL